MKLRSPLRRRRLVMLAGYLLLGLVFAAALLDHGGSRTGRDDWTRFDHQAFTVSHVVDGDTLHIRGSDSIETKVRLIGIDAPEMIDPTTGQPAHWAEQARNYVLARAEGKPVTVQLEPVQTRDRYGRLLAYIYLTDSECLNLALVRDGQAFADRRFRHSWRPQYEMAENEARKKQRGLWNDLSEHQMPTWRRNWLNSRREP